MATPRKMCVHCKARVAQQGYTSGLCNVCRKKPAIRAKHPCKPRKLEPSEAELEQMVIEQSANLSRWWFSEAEKLKRGLTD